MRNINELRFILIFTATTIVVVILAVSVILPPIVGWLSTLLPNWTASGKEFLQTFSWLDDLAAIVLIIVAGLITAANVITRRLLDPHLSVSQQVKLRSLDERTVHVRVEATLNNMSNVPVRISQITLWARRLYFGSDGIYGYTPVHGLVRDENQRFSEPHKLDGYEYSLEPRHVVILAGQSRQMALDCIVDIGEVPVRIRTRFRGGLPNADGESDEDWEAISFCDFDPCAKRICSKHPVQPCANGPDGSTEGIHGQHPEENADGETLSSC